MTRTERPVLWTADEARTATGGTGPEEWRATGVSIDSRTLEGGDLFVALVGDRLDGHDHVGDAFESGAAAAMVHRAVPGLAANRPLLVVPETLEGLRQLAAAARARASGRIVALTGSVGKTGTKELLRAALSAFGAVEANRGNLNNHWGAPLSLARLPRDAAFGVFELAMNHAGEIGPLARLVHPHIALITRIAPAHTAFFSSVDEIADAKAEIFEGIEPGGTAVLNRDDPYFGRLADAARAAGAGRILAFGRADGADVRLLGVEADESGSRVIAEIGERQFRYRLDIPGAHWAINSIGALAVIEALGLDVERAADALVQVKPTPGRGARRRVALPDGDGFDLIDESYNASPEAVRAALAVLALTRPAPGGRRIAVLGDMLELGSQGPRMHAELADAVLEHGIDRVHTVGERMAALRAALPVRLRGHHADTSEQGAAAIAADLHAGDVVLVKGSLAMRMAAVVRAILDREPAPPAAEAR